MELIVFFAFVGSNNSNKSTSTDKTAAKKIFFLLATVGKVSPPENKPRPLNKPCFFHGFSRHGL